MCVYLFRATLYKLIFVQRCTVPLWEIIDFKTVAEKYQRQKEWKVVKLIYYLV
jgi:hypothetical protein